MEISKIIPHIEALIFAADRPLPATEILDLLNNAIAFLEDRATPEAVEAAVEAIVEKYQSEFYAFEVKESGGGFQFLTKKEYYTTVAQINGEKFLKRLSTAALETLAIIAYRQPVSKGEIEYIRGVSSDYSLQKLLEKELISIAGRSEDLPGKPLLYATSKAFMDYFGINSAKDLPKLKEVFDEEMIAPTLINNDEERAALEEAAAGFLAVSETGELLEEVPTIPEAFLHEHQAKLEIDVSLLDKHNGNEAGTSTEGAETPDASEEETPAEGDDTENGLIEDISAAAPVEETEATELSEEDAEAEADEDFIEASEGENGNEDFAEAAGVDGSEDDAATEAESNDEGEYDASVEGEAEAENASAEESDEDDEEGEYEEEDEDDDADEEDDEDDDEDAEDAEDDDNEEDDDADEADETDEK